MFHPKKTGFFALIYQQIDDGLSAEQRARFNECRSLEARIKMVAGLDTTKLLMDQVTGPFLGKKSAAR